jgi:hypothetical protein
MSDDLSEEDEQIVTMFTNLLYIEIPLALLFIANLYLGFVKPGTGLLEGYNRIITIIIGLAVLVIIVFSFLIIGLPDTDEDMSVTVLIGTLFPFLIIFVYICIALYTIFVKGSGSAVRSAPVATGGGRRKLASKSKK